ncbi:MAG: hypothetical protein ABIT71_16030 [Vicinamibacteraceae bacterium]
MFMRLPESGSLIGSIVSGLGHTVADGNGIAVDAVTETQLGEALTAMAAGELEYVILEDGEEFLQAAGDGDGPYALQFSPASGDGLQEVPGGVTAAAMRAALQAYRRGDRDWRRPFQWSAV